MSLQTKFSVIRRFAKNNFENQYKTTIGADFVRKTIPWEGHEANKVKLQLWDIAGQDRFARLTRAYFNNAKGALVVCDVTRDGTFEAAANW